jgi:hypothetical protein
MNAPAGTAVIAPEVVATAQPLVADDKGLLARATATCPMEHTCA